MAGSLAAKLPGNLSPVEETARRDGRISGPAAGATRTERDGLGTVELPRDALFGAHTARAIRNFDLDGPRLEEFPQLLTALAQVKAAAAAANVELGALSPRAGAALMEAAREVAAGDFAKHFPIDVLQGGGGTSTNMNMNEVLANRAEELLGGDRGSYRSVHPNDHANRSQSTNDVFPTAIAIAVYRTAEAPLESLAHLESRLLALADAYPLLEHLGRTCLQDAVPIPVATVHRSHAQAIARARDDLETSRQRLLSVPLGGTAVGTGIGAPDGFRSAAIRHLRTETRLDVRSAEDPCEGLASLEAFVRVAEATAGAARVIARIGADLRLLASGPVGGIGEVELPVVQAGSSIMPGKVNPVLPELVMQVSYQLAGAAHTVRLAAAAGELEVTPMGPVVTVELLGGLDRLGRVARLFADRCLNGLSWRRERVAANLRGSLHEAVEAAADLGYDEASSGASARPRDVNESPAKESDAR